MKNEAPKKTTGTIITRIVTRRDNPPPQKKGDKKMSLNEAVFLGGKGEILPFRRKKSKPTRKAKTKRIQDVCLEKMKSHNFLFLKNQ